MLIKHQNTSLNDKNTRSASPCESRINTQKGGVEMGHSSTYSVAGGGSKEVISSEGMKISVNEINSTNTIYKRASEANSKSPAKKNTFESGEASLDEQNR